MRCVKRQEQALRRPDPCPEGGSPDFTQTGTLNLQASKFKKKMRLRWGIWVKWHMLLGRQRQEAG